MSETPYQFPEFPWRRSGSIGTVLEHGINLRERGRWYVPAYQRPLVWTQEQKVKFLESLILGLPVGEYTLHKNSDYTQEVVDGQQRWNAIFAYVDNEFPVFGMYYRDLNAFTEMRFLSIQFPHRLIENLTYTQRVEVYNRLAYGGTAHEIPKEN